ncbi:universal stress protein [Novosphingobium album (ex Liu et al. 2023)]|uniref:Universal stress protein n=1 Tax=Novosphingobium album (ex Liu et al. 2023) TaxID=3031130 RepID=A0ABT5WWL2_9SPHN|nr:universal stress protein [Novosphingobium album (ex Liu et al. 2023)]MDE8654282.1 universal stress protein [Novosphingobium album (ex Liu et al. 2023)]
MSQTTFPQRIALATDLSHRCDRALDRALLVAKAWQAELTVIHAVAPPEDVTLFGSLRDLPSWHRPPDPVRKVRDRIYRDLVREDPDVDIALHVKIGTPSEVVLEVAGQSHAEMIVTGVARDELLARMFLGDTVDRLIRKSPVPILIVRDRAFEPYHSMVVATDFSKSARIAFETALRFFPQTGISLFHAYDVPFAGYLGRSEVAKQFEDYGRDAADKFLAEAGVAPEATRKVSRMIEHGVPEALLRDYAENSRRHLTVVGTHGGGMVYETLIGSTARKIIDSVPGDVLLVPDPDRRNAG